jgi:L-fuconolactonase
MLKVDTHQHFWKYNPVKHSWINEEMAVIRKDFMPDDLQPILKNAGLSGCSSSR